jgi:hypothetical protein
MVGVIAQSISSVDMHGIFFDEWYQPVTSLFCNVRSQQSRRFRNVTPQVKKDIPQLLQGGGMINVVRERRRGAGICH